MRGQTGAQTKNSNVSGVVGRGGKGIEKGARGGTDNWIKGRRMADGPLVLNGGRGVVERGRVRLKRPRGEGDGRSKRI